jgi:hypothetical protein
MRFILAMTAMLACMSVQASAQDYNKRAGLEFSDTKCKTWTDRRIRAAIYEDASRMASWAFGFVSGVNLSTSNDKNALDFLSNVEPDSRGKPNAVTAWLDEYCGAHPQEGFVEAVIALTNALKQRAQHK